MTTLDPTIRRLDAIRRPRAVAVLCACLWGAAVMPCLAQQTATPAATDGTTVSFTAATRGAPLAIAEPGIAAVAPDLRNAPVAAGAPTGVATGSRIQNVLKHALALLGTPYRWGGTTTDGFDCSGLVGYVFRTTLGIELPRVSRDMVRTGELIDRGNLSPGDLVFFGRRKGRVDHVGIYLGDGRFVHAPRTGRDVTVSTLEGGYWDGKFLEARRVAGI
ncbi:MAG: C40 family peptidase [Luteimonas sp.]